MSDPTITPGSGAGSAQNTVNYLYGAGGSGDLVGADDSDVLNGGPGNEKLLGGAGNDILIYDTADQKIDGGDGTDVLRTDEAALGLLNSVGVQADAATGFSVVEVVPFKQNIKNIEVLLITDDAQSDPTKGGLLNLNAQDVLDMTDPNNHTLTVLGNPGDVVDLGIGASAWNDNGKVLDANGFHTYSQTFNGVDLMLKVEHTVVVHYASREGHCAQKNSARRFSCTTAVISFNPEQYAIGHKSLLRCPHQKPRLREKSIDSAGVDNAWRNGPGAIPQARTASAEPGAIAPLRNALSVQMHRR